MNFKGFKIKEVEKHKEEQSILICVPFQTKWVICAN